MTALMDRILVNPLQMSKPLLGALEGKRSVRLGEHLLIIEVRDDVGFVHYIDRRARIYRKRWIDTEATASVGTLLML